MTQKNFIKELDESGQDTTPVSLSRRDFLAMGAGAAAAFALPSLGKDSTAIAGTCSTQTSTTCTPPYNGLVCYNGFPQPYGGSLGTPSSPTGLDIVPYYGTVNDKPAVVRRSYNLVGTDTFTPPCTDSLEPGVQYFKLGPTFKFKASDPDQNTLNLKFTNKLPAGEDYIIPPEPPSPNTGDKGAPGRPKGFNAANLHFHGLHVSPSSINSSGDIVCGLESRDAAKSSDDMLFFIPAGDETHHPYEIVLPTFHAPGTHWYHAHNDGSTALHVVDGTAGALLIEDEGDACIDVDHDLLWIVQELEGTDLVTKVGTKAKFDKKTKKEVPKDKKDVPTDQLVFNCAPVPANLGFTVNGVYQPSLTMKVNELHRWRFLAGTATPRGFMRIVLYKIPDTAPSGCTYKNSTGGTSNCFVPSAPLVPPSGSTSAEQTDYANNLAAFLNSLSTPSPNPYRINMNLIAIDGISFYRDPPQSVSWWDMSPANRADFLVQLSEKGTYWVVKQPVITRGNLFGPGTVTGGPQATQVLATITVEGEVSEKKTIPTIIPGKFPTYLQTITDDELLKNPDKSNYVRPVVFAIAKEVKGLGCKNYDKSIKSAMPAPRSFVINDLPYSGNSTEDGPRYTAQLLANVPKDEKDSKGKVIEYQTGSFSAPETKRETVQVVKLNTCEEWIIFNYSNLVHPFHIHVNPFLLIESYDPNGKLDQQGIGRWWDVIGIPAAKFKNKKTLIEPGYVRIRSRFWDYWGEYVFHCHILIHEDLGMMQNVYVANNPSSKYPGNGPFEQVTTSPDPSISQNKVIGTPGFPASCYPTSYPTFQPLVDGRPKYPEQKDTSCIGGKTCEQTST